METRKILIATKTYPSISRKYRETVCTAGILLDDQDNPLQWIRIYPIRYRELEFDKRYPRWSIIRAKIERNDSGTNIWISPDPEKANQVLKNIAKKAKGKTVLLLCAEMDCKRCHRVEVANQLQNLIHHQIKHLT
ncbi:DUF488 family protein [Gloeothece verrucosa]|uniref:DUF488 domain-containing protein n=1 Tax=Gloeothece verrucosa (strain PCC 7822) TaxID=497965 RepID=E0UJS3_GLOV7|nr:DUF488 family protein [Gloeothece verrucosa]ADN13434.1 hypothetical protein Cyan7822_1438 [Gloeothece verrucosa PCC 7822]